jgi:hypothetical protein
MMRGVRVAIKQLSQNWAFLCFTLATSPFTVTFPTMGKGHEMGTINLRQEDKSDTCEVWVCQETGEPYAIERVDGAYSVDSERGHIGTRVYRDAALQLVEQQARLDFLTAQSVSAFA